MKATLEQWGRTGAAVLLTVALMAGNSAHASQTCNGAVLGVTIPDSVYGAGGWIRNQPGNDTAIVFVHGSRSDATQAFTSKKDDLKQPGVYWPCLLTTDNAFNNANIFVVQYRSHTVKESTPIPEAAEGVMRAFSNSGTAGGLIANAGASPKPLTQHARIIFIAHSLGGVVLRMALTRDETLPVLAKTRLIYLASVPGGRVDKAGVWEDVLENEQFRELSQPAVFQQVEKDWNRVVAGKNQPALVCVAPTKRDVAVPFNSRKSGDHDGTAQPSALEYTVTPESTWDICSRDKARRPLAQTVVGEVKVAGNHSEVVKPPALDADAHQTFRKYYLAAQQ
jgi:hypothetical protein